MDPALQASPSFVDWGVAGSAYPGEDESGDRHVVAPFPEGVLLAAVDGLGHGGAAGAAARTAVEILESYRAESVISLIRRCHSGLSGTRGAVMSLATYQALEHTLTWIGIGNVEGVLLRFDPSANPTRETLLLRGGVVGYHLPQLNHSSIRVCRGDLLALVTDGVSSDFVSSLSPDGLPPQRMAERILSRHGMRSDDALVLVAQFLGGAC